MTQNAPKTSVTQPPKLPVQRLDRSRAYGEVHGESGLQAYAQRALNIEGWPYDAHGDLMEAALSVAQRDALAKRRARRAAEIAASPAEAENAPIDEEVVEEEHEHAQEDDEFNALMFLTREISYPARVVQTALKKRYFVNKPSIQAAALYLVVAAKTTAGSIKSSVNYAAIESEVVLEEAESLLYSMLRVREMKCLSTLAMSAGDSTKAVPTGYLDPIGKLRDTKNTKYIQVHEDELLNRRVYNSSGILASGQPMFWTVLSDLVQFDMKFDEARTLYLVHFKKLTALGSGNLTNFLTSRYPHLLRQACIVRAHAFMKNWTAHNSELPMLATMIERINAESDLSYRGADIDQE